MDGMSDVVGGGDYGSWNVSKTEGPLGLTCDPQLVGGYPCYASCAGPDPDTADCGYLAGSCDWTSCHDDVAYTEVRIVMMVVILTMTMVKAVLYDVTSKLCVDTARMHVSGMSNGGMFIWTRVMERLAATFASAGTGHTRLHGLGITCRQPQRRLFLRFPLIFSAPTDQTLN